jgi:hypothetical protein
VFDLHCSTLVTESLIKGLSAIESSNPSISTSHLLKPIDDLTREVQMGRDQVLGGSNQGYPIEASNDLINLSEIGWQHLTKRSFNFNDPRSMPRPILPC